MIDTDKYEGHTPAPWCYYHSNQFIETEEGIHLFTNCMSINDPAHDANSELVADAPLLLAEVKRLRKITDFVKSSIDFHYHSIDNNTGGFVNWMEFARELHLMLYGGDE